jgi:glycosyl transferase family 25
MRGIGPMEKIAHTAEQGILTSQRDSRIAVMVISLPTAQSRRQVVDQYLSKLDLPWRFFEAKRYESAAMRGDDPINISTKLSDGEVGCFLSHRSLWKEISGMAVDYAIVLEDDTVLIPSVDYRGLFALLRELDIDVIRLEAHQMGRARAVAYLGPLYGLLCRITYPRYGLGTGCYALTPRAAGVFYSAVSQVEVPVDLWLEGYKNHRLPIYNLFPLPAIEIRSQTTILSRASSQLSSDLFHYAFRRITLAFSDALDEWRLSRLDYALRKRIDRLHPGMAVWPRTELRKHLHQMFWPQKTRDP